MPAYSGEQVISHGITDVATVVWDNTYPVDTVLQISTEQYSVMTIAIHAEVPSIDGIVQLESSNDAIHWHPIAMSRFDTLVRQTEIKLSEITITMWQGNCAGCGNFPGS